mgnify:CR=1 FL=1
MPGSERRILRGAYPDFSTWVVAATLRLSESCCAATTSRLRMERHDADGVVPGLVQTRNRRRPPVVGACDGGAITSDAGARLLGDTDKAIRLVSRLAGCFQDGCRVSRGDRALSRVRATESRAASPPMRVTIPWREDINMCSCSRKRARSKPSRSACQHSDCDDPDVSRAAPGHHCEKLSRGSAPC